MIRKFRVEDKVRIIKGCRHHPCLTPFTETKYKCPYSDKIGFIKRITLVGKTYYYEVLCIRDKRSRRLYEGCGSFTTTCLELVESSIKPFGIVSFMKGIIK